MRGYRTYPGSPAIHLTPWASDAFTRGDWEHIRATLDAEAVVISARAPSGPFVAKVGYLAARGGSIRAAVDRLPREVRRA